MKPKILLIADTPTWIFARHCSEITKRLSHKYDFTTVYRDDESFIKFPISELEKFNLIYCLDSRLPHYSNKLQVPQICGIRSMFCYEHTTPEKYWTTAIKSQFKSFHVVNQQQMKDFSFANPVYIPHGIDIDLFSTKTEHNQELIVGCTGNPNSGGEKGFDIIQKACQNAGLMLNSATASKGQTIRPLNEMVDWHKSIDILVSLSKSEGLNNPILESASVGNLIVSTPVGAVINELHDNVVIVDRTVESLTSALIHIKSNWNTYEMKRNALQTLVREKFDWNRCIERFDAWFDQMMKK